MTNSARVISNGQSLGQIVEIITAGPQGGLGGQLGELQDVNTDLAVDKSVLVYDAALATWVGSDINTTVTLTDGYATLDTTQTISGNKTFSGTIALGSSASATTPSTSDNSTAVATTAYVKGQSYLTGNQNITVSGDVSGSGTTAISLTLGSVGTAGTYYKVTTDAKGRVTSGSSSLIAADIPDLSSTYLPTTGGTISSNLTITGNLTVSGTTTTVNSTTVDVADKNLTLGNVASPTNTTANGGGITLKGATDKTFNWVSSTSAWTSSEHFDLASGKAFYINGASVLSGTTLGSGVTGSSLTSVGTLSSGSLGTGFTTVAVAQGGTGATTLTGLVKGNGTSAFTAAVAGTDYLSPSSDIDGGVF